jgi:hypothetical protein
LTNLYIFCVLAAECPHEDQAPQHAEAGSVPRDLLSALQQTFQQ